MCRKYPASRPRNIGLAHVVLQRNSSALRIIVHQLSQGVVLHAKAGDNGKLAMKLVTAESARTNAKLAHTAETQIHLQV